jgi:hypothetical protein
MKVVRFLLVAALITPFALAGWSRAQAQDTDAKVKANLAKLSPEDRKLAEEQKYCPIMEDKLLGERGKPVKTIVKGEVVFVCCKGCLKRVNADPDGTVTKVKELKKKNGDSSR